MFEQVLSPEIRAKPFEISQDSQSRRGNSHSSDYMMNLYSSLLNNEVIKVSLFKSNQTHFSLDKL